MFECELKYKCTNIDCDHYATHTHTVECDEGCCNISYNDLINCKCVNIRKLKLDKLKNCGV